MQTRNPLQPKNFPPTLEPLTPHSTHRLTLPHRPYPAASRKEGEAAPSNLHKARAVLHVIHSQTRFLGLTAASNQEFRARLQVRFLERTSSSSLIIDGLATMSLPVYYAVGLRRMILFCRSFCCMSCKFVLATYACMTHERSSLPFRAMHAD